MDAIVDAFEYIIEFFKTIWNLVQHIFTALSKAIEIFIKIVVKTIAVIGTLPNWLTIYAMITVTITIIYFIINRQGGKNE